jgi:hypothetical protein
MNTNLFVLASGLSDHDLLARIGALAGKERETSAELVAHLAALDARPSLYAAQGHGSLFSYCTRVLRLSEDAACNRIDAARACRRFPIILDLLAAGELSLASVRKLRPCLTPENHETVLARARGRSCQEVLSLIAELAPRPDVPSSVRKLPTPAPAPPLTTAPFTPATHAAEAAPETLSPILTAQPATRRPIVEPTSPDRYRVQFTIGKETHERLQRLQALLRREIPNGDPGLIFDRAIALLLERVEKEKLGLTTKPRPIRLGTDRSTLRHTPNQSKRVAWRRDDALCAFVAPNGQRCRERAFLEFHHIEAFAFGGPSTPENISLRCRRHNQYEAERVFGPRGRPADGDAWDVRTDRHV